MKTLQRHIEEKLIINKNFNDCDDIKKMFNNIEFSWENSSREMLRTDEDICDIVNEYIKFHNIKCISNFEEFKKINNHNDSYLMIYNSDIKEMDLFYKNDYNRYDVIYIFARHLYGSGQRGISHYSFSYEYDITDAQMHVLHNNIDWDNENVEYYEISKETFNKISDLYKFVSNKIK